MSGWVVTVAGVAILTVLCDVILPDGSNKKYIRAVLGVVVSFVIAQPLLLWAGDAFGVKDTTSEQQFVVLQQSYLDGIAERKYSAVEQQIYKTLQTSGYKVGQVSIKQGVASITLQGSSDIDVAHSAKKLCEDLFAEFKFQFLWSGS